MAAGVHCMLLCRHDRRGAILVDSKIRLVSTVLLLHRAPVVQAEAASTPLVPLVPELPPLPAGMLCTPTVGIQATTRSPRTPARSHPGPSKDGGAVEHLPSVCSGDRRGHSTPPRSAALRSQPLRSGPRGGSSPLRGASSPPRSAPQRAGVGKVATRSSSVTQATAHNTSPSAQPRAYRPQSPVFSPSSPPDQIKAAEIGLARERGRMPGKLPAPLHYGELATPEQKAWTSLFVRQWSATCTPEGVRELQQEQELATMPPLQGQPPLLQNLDRKLEAVQATQREGPPQPPQVGRSLEHEPSVVRKLVEDIGSLERQLQASTSSGTLEGALTALRVGGQPEVYVEADIRQERQRQEEEEETAARTIQAAVRGPRHVQANHSSSDPLRGQQASPTPDKLLHASTGDGDPLAGWAAAATLGTNILQMLSQSLEVEVALHVPVNGWRPDSAAAARDHIALVENETVRLLRVSELNRADEALQAAQAKVEKVAAVAEAVQRSRQAHVDAAATTKPAR